MQQDRPEIRPDEILIIRNVEEDFHAIVDIRGQLYRAHYLIDKDNPADQQLRIDDRLKVVSMNTAGWDQTTHAERVTSQGQGDGHHFVFQEYQAVPQQG